LSLRSEARERGIAELGGGVDRQGERWLEGCEGQGEERREVKGKENCPGSSKSTRKQGHERRERRWATCLLKLRKGLAEKRGVSPDSFRYTRPKRAQPSAWENESGKWPGAAKRATAGEKSSGMKRSGFLQRNRTGFEKGGGRGKKGSNTQDEKREGRRLKDRPKKMNRSSRVNDNYKAKRWGQ